MWEMKPGGGSWPGTQQCSPGVTVLVSTKPYEILRDINGRISGGQEKGSIMAFFAITLWFILIFMNCLWKLFISHLQGTFSLTICLLQIKKHSKKVSLPAKLYLVQQSSDLYDSFQLLDCQPSWIFHQIVPVFWLWNYCYLLFATHLCHALAATVGAVQWNLVKCSLLQYNAVKCSTHHSSWYYLWYIARG